MVVVFVVVFLFILLGIVLYLKLVQSRLQYSLLYVRWYHSFCIWSALCLYLESFTVEFIGPKYWMRLSSNQMLDNC